MSGRHDGDEDDGGDYAASSPNGEYSQKRGAHVPRGDGMSRKGGKRRKA